MRPALALGALLLASSVTARVVAAPKRNAVSWEPFSLLARGLLVQYERLALPRVSVLGGAGARFGAGDDFASETWVLKAEGRYWLQRERGMTGPYVALASIAARTAVESRRRDRSLGAYWQVEQSARFGYRFVVFGVQEITPSWGLSLIHELDERGLLAPNTTGTIGMNLTVGWLF